MQDSGPDNYYNMLEAYDFEYFLDNFKVTPLSESFFTMTMKRLGVSDSFMLYGKLVFMHVSSSEILCPIKKNRLQLIKVRLNFYMISDNSRVSPGFVDCSLFNRRIVLKDDYHLKRMDTLAYISVEFNYLQILEWTFFISARLRQFN